MSEYKDYGYTNANYTHIYKYLLSPLLSLLSKEKNKLILDVGCGNGWLANLLIEKGYTVYGTDATAMGIEIAKQKNPDNFFVQDLSTDDLPIELQHLKFDTIISTEVIEHLYSPRQYLAFCKKILLKSGGGKLVISTPYHGYFKNVILALSGKMDGHFTVLWDGGHIKFWPFNTLSNVLEENGFKNIKLKGCGRFPFLWKSMIVYCDI